MVKPSEKKALRLFHDTARRVPAYKDFLKRARVNPEKIKTVEDFTQVPITDTKNYISEYPLEKRCWDGKLSATKLIAASSGTKGEPKFWPRSAEQDLEAARIHEFLFRTYFQADKHSTLLLVGFPMGVYVSGVATLLPSWLTGLKNKNLTIMSIGNNKAEILRAVHQLSNQYEQTILIGHPFFIKDVIETGANEGVRWSKKNIGLMFCSEGFSEDWRRYLAEKAGMPARSMRIFNTYGSSEMLLMAYETEFSIAIKELAEKNGAFLKELADDSVPPQFFQYDPLLRYIESVEKELIFTSSSGIPLIRFNLHDRGEVYSLEQIKKTAGATLLTKPIHPLPVISLWGRSDNTLKFYAANIYPEHIKGGLDTSIFFKTLTGKFTMRKEYLKNHDEFLEINIELQPKIKPTRALEAKIRDTLVQQLQKTNMEYKFLREHLDKNIVPRIKLWPYNDGKYFKPGLKPRYIVHT